MPRSVREFVLPAVRAAVVCVSVGWLGAAPATAQTVLKLSSYLPSSHWIMADGVREWASEVEKASNGTLKINVYTTPIGRPDQQFDLAKDGITDLALGVLTYTPGRGVIYEIGAAPGAGQLSESRGVAAWRLTKRTPAMLKEYEGVVPLAVASTPPMVFLTRTPPIENVGQFSGQKAFVSSAAGSAVAKSLGMVPVVQPPTSAFQLISGGVVDGGFLTADGISAFKLERVAKGVLITPGGFGGGLMFLGMNPDAYGKLTDQQRAALQKASGENFARIIGKIWDKRDAAGLAAAQAHGAVVKQADAAMVAAIGQRTAQADALWIGEVAARRPGVDGKALLADFRAEVQRVEAEIAKR
jgi:TRAP-type C4-dicarboxylate transport system, periplasmic component